jgi:NADH-quinone oxidoreductase subunit L
LRDLPPRRLRSKDEIPASVWSTDNYVLWGIGVVTAILTAPYMTRQVWLVFYGNERWNEEPAHWPGEPLS